MIRPGDAEFQFGPDSPHDWCETNFFPFAVPEERISGSFYLLSRPKLGVAMSDVSVQDRIAPAWEDQLYVDNQQHLTCPDSGPKRSTAPSSSDNLHCSSQQWLNANLTLSQSLIGIHINVIRKSQIESQ